MASRLPAEHRRSQLLDVALAVFAEHGFHGTSMNDVADAAGVTKPVLYQHFESKRSLYLELLGVVGERLTSAVIGATAAAPGPREQVELGIYAYFGFVRDSPAAFWLMFGGGTRRDEEFAAQATKVERAIAEAIADLIEVEGLDRPGRVMLAHGIVGLAEGTSRHCVTSDEPADFDRAAQLVADMAWRGLRGITTDAR